ncbi:MAG: Outer membrane protein assembly factor BamB [Acidimicrobiales bacterium]|nr:MAG: hypothetical protein EDR02_16135 [Actinomycetota bacterium]MBV6510442.1 Outer membrane protein assembly factor BamB [Acidimicrobiales bacterium]RIK03753.1 MAG: hypothetical protein DCC48_15605 [Acidobacteriota bacterium]
MRSDDPTDTSREGSADTPAPAADDDLPQAAVETEDARPTRRDRRQHRRRRWWIAASTAVAVALLAGGATAWFVLRPSGEEADVEPVSESATDPGSGPSVGPDTSAAPDTATTAPPFNGWVNPDSVGQPWGDTVPGLLTFRGNPTRTYYGAGPVPSDPTILWSYPDARMCSLSSDGGEVSQWCGMGWTGQPAVFDRDGKTWVVFGAFDRAVHFLDAESGTDLLPPFETGDIIKGSVTVDPDGFPLVYTGSRDGFYRILAIDGGEARELWKLDADAVSPTKWNDDWDSSGLVIADYLFIGGENSNIHIVKLNRGHDADGRVSVNPELVWNAPGWDDELLGAIGDSNVSIENSVAIYENTLYFANSGGLVQGWDISGVTLGFEPTRVFRFWTGDDTDASVVIDGEGYLYVASEWERFTDRSSEVGQLMKLDPRNVDNPLVWKVDDRDAQPAGIWGTPALHDDVVYAATNGGRFMAVDRATGEIRWSKQLPAPTWQSPVVVDDVLVMGDCNGTLHAYDVSDTTIDPPELWSVEIGGCIEATPAVWNGRIYVGTRAGFFHALGDG